MRPIKGLDFILWLIVLGAWAVLETRGIFSKNEWTFTQIVVNYVPPDIIAATLGWLIWHFLIHPHVRA